MDEKFLSAIQNIDTHDAKTSVESVLRIFSAISTLNECGVIAAHQTFNFFLEERKKQDEATEKRIGHIKEALKTRMIHLCASTPKESRKGLAIAFASAMSSDSFYIICFRRILEAP